MLMPKRVKYAKHSAAAEKEKLCEALKLILAIMDCKRWNLRGSLPVKLKLRAAPLFMQ
jgi:hypothetical protein